MGEDKKLVMDLGAHKGEDAEEYLKLGYRVVAVEANFELVVEMGEKFQGVEDIIIVHNAVCDRDNGYVAFYPNERSDWGSVVPPDNLTVIDSVRVPAVTLPTLFSVYGTPYYLKVDVEGMDEVVARQLAEVPEKPEYVSFELCTRGWMNIFWYLKQAGYTRYQLRQQIYNQPYTSGPFGEHLCAYHWNDEERAMYEYLDWRREKAEAKLSDPDIDFGWLDLHAGR